MKTPKGHVILKSKQQFPVFNLIDYNNSLAENLAYYNLEVDTKTKKDWAIEYYKSQGNPIDQLKRVHEGYFPTVGSVIHMLKYREIPLEEKQVLYIRNKYNELLTHVPIEKEELPVLELTKEEKGATMLSGHIAEFEAMIDHRDAVTVDIFTSTTKNYLLRNEIKPPMAKKISIWFKPNVKEIKDVLDQKDEQLVEGYSHLSRRELKKLLECYQSLITSCELTSAITKAARKPRKRKAKAPSELCKNVKFLAEIPELKLRSIRPEKIINSSEVWVYNIKIRRLFRYTALQGHTISIKGTTLINIDPEKSGGRILRKPETQLKDVDAYSSRPMNKLYDGIRATESRGTGRLSEDTLILKCFT